MAALCLLVLVLPSSAQGPTLLPRGRVDSSIVSPSTGFSESNRITWKNSVLSLLIPGSGQVIGGQERGALYLVAEAFLLTRVISERNAGERERNRYRALAINVARRRFGGIETDTVFEYYDKMGKFIESGPFSVATDGSLIPPSDPETFNGDIWALARRTFLPDPDGIVDTESVEYQRALAFYRRRAIGPNFRWSWRNAGLERDLFRLGIKDSDNAFKRASSQLGALVANHLLSAVDAFISYRLGAETTINSAYLPDDGLEGPTFNLNVTVGF